MELQLDPVNRTFYACDITMDPGSSFPLQFLPVRSTGGTLTITSPNFPSPYPSDYLCLYSIPPCRDPREIQYISWMSENFVLEKGNDFSFLSDTCPDLLEIIISPNEGGSGLFVSELSAVSFITF